MNFLVLDFSGIMDSLTAFLDVVIWPATLLFILVFFRRSFAQAMTRLGSIKADKTGFSLVFQDKIDQAKSLFKGLGGTAKAYKGLGNTISSAGNPQQQLQQMNTEIYQRLLAIASENNMAVENKNASQLCAQFSQVGLFPIEKAEKVEALIQLTSSPDTQITQQQVDEVKAFYLATEI